jgi:hypothetical protein
VSTFFDSVVAQLRSGVPAQDSELDWCAEPAVMADALPDGSRVLVVTPGFVESRHVVGLVLDRRGRLRSVLKVPRSITADHAVVHEATVLRRLGQRAPGLAGTTPGALACVRVDGRRLLLESPLNGEPLTHARARTDAAARGSVLTWVDGLPTTGEADGADLLALLLEPLLDRLVTLLPEGHELHGSVAATRAAVAPLRGRLLPTVFEHGDPAHPNILILDGPGSAIGLVDWELGREYGVIGHDLAQLLAFLAFAEAGVHGVAAEVPVFERELADPSGASRRAFAQHVAARTDADLEPALFVLAWARSALRILDRLAPSAAGAADDPASVLREVEASRNVALWRSAVAPRG